MRFGLRPAVAPASAGATMLKPVRSELVDCSFLQGGKENTVLRPAQHERPRACANIGFGFARRGGVGALQRC